MDDANDVVSISPYQLERWQALKNADNVEHRFVYMLAPILEYLYHAVGKQIRDSSQLTYLFNAFDLVSWLRHDLTTTFAPMLARCCVLEMHYAKEAGYLKGDTPEMRFASYIDLLADPAFVASFMQKYLILQSIIDRRATYYLHAMSEFLNHLDQDFIRVSQQLLPNVQGLQIDTLTSDGADVHAQGKHVFILQLLDVTRERYQLVYKPHSLAPEAAFNDIILWFNQYVSECTLYPIKLVSYSDHGWMEFITHQPCRNESELKLFYRRSGYLLALLYFFNIQDIHFENLIAHGSYPVIVDLECFLSSPLKKSEIIGTVLNYLFLPMKYFLEEKQEYMDRSAIGFHGGQIAVFKKYTWEFPGTDEMRYVYSQQRSVVANNQPYLAAKGDVNPYHYGNELLSGFSDAYHIFIQHGIGYFSNVFRFEKIMIRLIMRPTAEYGQLLWNSYHPDTLQDLDAYDAHWAWLARDETKDPGVIAAERFDLINGDIPIFHGFAGSRNIYDSYATEMSYRLKRSGWEHFVERLNKVFSVEDCRRQVHLIKMSFALIKQADTKTSLNLAEYVNKTELTAISGAEKLLDELVQLAFIQDEQITWPDVASKSHDENTVTNPGLTGYDLYSGNLGILLVFLYGNYLIPKEIYLNIIQQVLRQLTVEILDSSVPAPWLKSISAFNGLAGALYVITVAERLGYKIDERLVPYLLDASQQYLETDQQYDVLAGVAGLILVLLSHYHFKPSTELLDLLVYCVEYLLKHYPNPDVLTAFFTKTANQPLLGFAHGLSGIAYALIRVSKLINTPQSTKWIDKALKHIDKVYEHHGYFPDFRSQIKQNEPAAAVSCWCNGYVGVGFLYLLLRQESQFASDIPYQRIFNEIQRTELLDVAGHLCCGTLGVIDLLLECEQHQLATPLAEFSQQLLNAVADNQYNAYAKYEGLPSNLMQGKAGIAYILLRLAAPDIVKSVLTLE